jgi:hypothetical protein
MAEKNDEQLTAEWLKAEGDLYGAHQAHRSASHAQTNAINRLNDAKKAEAAAWAALEEHRAKVVKGVA